MKKIIFLLCFIFIQAFCLNIKASETENILDVLKGNLDDVFLVNVMGSYFPLPNRYSFVQNANDGTLKLVSGPIIRFFIKNIPQDNIPVGTIFIGPVNKCKFCDSNSKLSLDDKVNIELIDEFKSVIVIKVNLNITESSEDSFIIFDKKHYILISDPKKETWLAAIKVLKELMP